MSLSKDGQPEIYIMDVANRSVERITNNNSIDTEPAWAPDGRSLLFTSDRKWWPPALPVLDGRWRSRTLDVYR